MKKLKESQQELKKQVRCPFNDCFKCCIDTKMLLTNEDLTRIESFGHSREDFCINPSENDGFWQLKNIKGRCYFLSTSGKCTIYEYRPFGCKVYPLVFELSEEDVIIDDECREPQWFAEQVYQEEQISFVKKIAETLLKEKK